MPSNKEIINFCLEGSVLSQCKSIARDKNKKWKLFWFAVFIITLAAGLWYGSTAIQDYLSYPSQVRYYDAEIQELPFPAVTVCNLNPMDKNKNIYDTNIKELMVLYRYYASQRTNNTSTPPKKEPMNSRFKRSGPNTYTLNLNGEECGPKTTTAAVTTTQEPTTTTIFTTTEVPTTVLSSTPEFTTTTASTAVAIETTTPVSLTTTVSTAESGPILYTLYSNGDECVPKTTTATTQETFASTSLAALVSTTIYQPTTSDALESTKITQTKTSNPSVTSSLTQSQTTDASASSTRKSQSTITADALTSDASATTSASQSPTTDTLETTKLTESPTSDTSATTMLTRLSTTDVAKQTTTVPQSPTTDAKTTLITTKSSTVDKSVFETTTLTRSPTTDDLKQTTKLRDTSTTDKSAVGTTTPLSKSLTTDESQSTTNLDHSPRDSSSKTTIELTQSPTTDNSNSKTIKILTTKPATPPQEITESAVEDTAKTSKATSETPTTEATAGSKFTKTTPPPLSTSTVAKVLSSSTHSAESASSTSTSETIPSETILTHPSSTVESSTTEKYTTAFPSELPSDKVPSSTTIFKSPTSQSTSTLSSSAIKLESSTIANQMETQEYTRISSTKTTTESISKTPPSSTNSFEHIFTSDQITTSPTLPSEIQTTTVHSSIVSTTSNDDNKNDATTLEQNNQVSAMSSTTVNQMQTQQYTTFPTTIDRDDGTTTTSLTDLTSTVSYSSSTEKAEPLVETSAAGPLITPTFTKTTDISTGSTSSAAFSTNEKPNENAGSTLPTWSTSSSNAQSSGDETVSSSSSKLPTTLSDVTRSPTFNSELISSTPSSIASTTPEPIVFETYTQKQINELEAKYKINSTSTSRIALEAKIQDRLVGIMRINHTGGYGIKDIIIQCTFDKDECDMDNDFVQMYDPWYGNCYTFNYDGRYGITRAGTDFGLKMLVISNVSEYMETSSRSGFKIVLHKQGYAPFPNSEGLFVKTGKHSSINVKYRRFEALPAPYGICQPDKNTTDYIYEGYYTAEGCLRSCYQNKIIENCSCADPRYPKPKGSNVSWCDGTNLKNFLCYANYLETQGDFPKVSSCYCPPGCTKHTFNHNIATAKWPLKVEPFITPLCNGYWPKTNIKCYDAYENNAAMIGISHMRLLYRRTIQYAEYWWWDVFEMFMGNLGLFTGITCLAAFEFLEVIILLLWRPNWISEAEADDDDNEMEEMPRKKDNKIYDSSMIEENSMDIPLPFIGHTSAIGLDPSLESGDANRSTKTSLDISNELESAEPNQPKSSGFQLMQGSSLVDNELEKYLNSLLFKPQICPFNWRKYHPELPMEMGYNSPYSNNPYLPVLPPQSVDSEQSGSSNDTTPMKFDEKNEADVSVSHASNADIRRRSSIKPKDISTKSRDNK
uniref:Uncharacterized protein n=1 Tax=Panagrolaimus davidi TaxID=227884 RepID=A0A914P3E6_9BILA